MLSETHCLLNVGRIWCREPRAPCGSSDRAARGGHSGSPHDPLPPSSSYSHTRRSRAHPGKVASIATERGISWVQAREWVHSTKTERIFLACFSEKRYTPWTVMCNHRTCADVLSGKNDGRIKYK
jgi:hypothetical protein